MLVFLSLLQFYLTGPMITFAQVVQNESSLPQVQENDDTIRIRWPFCPSYPKNGCITKLWVDLEVNIDAYIQRRNASHESWFEIIQQTKKDIKPLARALQSYFKSVGISDVSRKAGIVQGMIQAVHYAYDNCDSRNPEAGCNEEDQTGWTEYPKYGLEFIIDQKGDCEDATIISSTLFQQVGIESWFILWHRKGGGGGHASTALTLAQGDLKKVSIPNRSEYVVHPKTKAPLISADSVGSLTGCNGNCAPLGWNEWGKASLFVAGAWKTDDSSIDKRTGGAWTKEGGVFKKFKRDRRKDSRKTIKDELKKNREGWDAQTRKRLSRLKVNKERINYLIKRFNPYSKKTDEGWIFIMSIMMAILGLSFYGMYAKRQRRLKLVTEFHETEKNSYF